MKIKSVFINKLVRNIEFEFKINDLKYVEDCDRLSTAEDILLSDNVKKNLNIGIVKDIDFAPYYTNFEKLLKTNNINYKFFNIHSANWLEDVKEFDCVIGDLYWFHGN